MTTLLLVLHLILWAHFLYYNHRVIRVTNVAVKTTDHRLTLVTQAGAKLGPADRINSDFLSGFNQLALTKLNARELANITALKDIISIALENLKSSSQ